MPNINELKISKNMRKDIEYKMYHNLKIRLSAFLTILNHPDKTN